MSHYPTTIRDLTGNPCIEAMELRGWAGLPDDVNAEMDAAFGYGTEADELTEREIDELFVAEMERRDREAAEVFGGEGDDEPDPPTAGAIHPDYPRFVEECRRATDSALIIGIYSRTDESPTPSVCFGDAADKAAWVSAAADELADRLEGIARKAA